MPGLNQLKQFNDDILSLGDETTLRSSRGEKPVKISIPKNVKDEDDSEEFVLGMPENEILQEESNVDEDLSDLIGQSSSNENNSKSETPNFDAPDMSSLLTPNNNADENMPDLSMFMDEPTEEKVPEQEKEPEPVSVADLGLDALLSGAGFDEPENSEAQNENPTPNENATQDFEELQGDRPLDSSQNDYFPLDDLEPLDNPEVQTENQTNNSEAKNISPTDENKSQNPNPIEDFDLPDFDDSDFDDLLNESSPTESPTAENENTQKESENSSAENQSSENNDDLSNLIDIPDLGDGVFGKDENLTEPTQDFLNENDNKTEQSTSTGETKTNNQEDDFSSPQGLFDSSDIEMPKTDETENSTESADDIFSTEGLDDFDKPQKSESENNDLNIEDIGDIENLDDLDFSKSSDDSKTDENHENQSNKKSDDVFDSFDFDNFDSEKKENSSSTNNANEENQNDENIFDDDDSKNSEDENLDNVPIEDFDTSEMDGLDFGIPDTDSQLKKDSSDFELGSNDDFAMENDFEIPGFSDVDTAKEEKKSVPKSKNSNKKDKNIDEADFSGALEGDKLPPNTLSDEQYKKFLKNFNEYPLNVRLAFEDFIVKDEFTDDAEFEIIEKILNKAPARQIANLLEKMLDTSIPVPRDFEHRTAEEYEAYKKSISYQLKNKIIPGFIVAVVVFFVGWGIFKFVQNNVYRPLRANHYYKQGYVLLEQEEYPSSEIKFNQAIEYRYNKKWFFKYARGYKNHKQYQRAEKMYENILICFNHDKQAGLEYADMELNELANYEKAEEIIKRQILDYHINDKDGILKLGDVYLEWGTEKEPEKLDLAREQYANLIQLYKSNDLYESRMMRYFIRTDNLRQVLMSKARFENREKSLSNEDWTELGGYLLEKSFGPIAPSDEELRYQIGGLRKILQTAVKTNPQNPVSQYNLARYYIQTSENLGIEPTLKNAINAFNSSSSLKKRDIYKFIDSYRLLGEHYISTSEYLKAQDQLAQGISLYTTQRDNSGFEGNQQIGKLYEDLANLKYFVSGDYDEALQNYKSSVELKNDTPSIRYKIGYIQYQKDNYAEALGSFMKAGDGNIKDKNLMQAMANTLSLRGDDYAAQGYYEQLLQTLDDEIANRGILLPQTNEKDSDIVDTYMKASNNYGVTLYKLAKKTGNSNLNAQATVQFSQSVRAWDALTRNQTTMTRLGGSNLAEQNIKYINNPIPEFEPAIYIDIKKTIDGKEKF